MSNFWHGFAYATACLITIYGSYLFGRYDGKNDVIAACAYYQKYAIDGTQVLLCSAIITPRDLEPTVAETNAKFYSKENKDLHKKDRK